jgi:prepilin-type processing-associated H-X9-DG protein
MRRVNFAVCMILGPIAICIVLCLIPRAHPHSTRMYCANNLKQIGLATQNYYETLGAGFPRGTHANPQLPPEDRLSWLVDLLPFLEQDNVFKSINLEESWSSVRNGEAVGKHIKTFLCPASAVTSKAGSAASTNYVGLTGIGPDSALLPMDSPRAGFFGYERVLTFEDIKDGTGTTIMVIETDVQLGPWAAGGTPTLRFVDPEDQPYIGVSRPFGGLHQVDRGWFRKSRVANVAFVDGSVRFLDESMNLVVFQALVTIAGGEEIPADY